MGAFETTLALAGGAALLTGGEAISYRPAGGAPVSLAALIDRRELEGIEGLGRGPRAIVRIRNDAVAGRAARDVDTGGDAVTWRPKPGGASRTSRVQEILDQDAAFVTLLIQ